MQCRDCKFLSTPEIIGDDVYECVRCTLGLWDSHILDSSGQPTEQTIPQWYSYGSSQLNRGPVRRYGDACTQGRPKAGLR